VPADQPPEVAAGFLNAYRILVADLVVLSMCEDPDVAAALGDVVRSVKEVPVIATVQRPRPVAPVAGLRVAFFTTAPPAAHEILARHLQVEHGAAEVVVSGNLSNRAALADDVRRVDADVVLVELKAAAVDVVAEAAVEHGVDVVLADADVQALPGEAGLDDALWQLAAHARGGVR
jgi:cyclic 2,3-diphosphoglycerate synthetase